MMYDSYFTTQIFEEVGIECNFYLSELFSSLGFNEESQIALVKLLHFSSAFKSDNQLVRFLNCSTIKSDCNYQLLLKCFSFETEEGTKKWLIEHTQKEWFARKKERWNSDVPSWITDFYDKDLLYNTLIETKICSKIQPKFLWYDAVAVFGATGKEMLRRFDYIKEMLPEVNHLYLLTGYRKIENTENGLERDGGESYLLNLSLRLNMQISNLSEDNIMQDIAYSKFNGSKIHVVYGKISDKLNRATTRTTLEAFFEINHKENASVLFVSGAPNILPQSLTVQEISGKKLEVVGNECNHLKFINTSTTTLHSMIMPIAGAFYEFIAKA